ncbi:MAG: hypothetical protein ACOC6C_02065 [Verrucomicrobiota bacterium]
MINQARFALRLILVKLTLAITISSAPGEPNQRQLFWEAPPSEHPPRTAIEVEYFRSHPRCIFRPDDRKNWGRTKAEVRNLYRTDPVFKAVFDDALKVKIDNGWQHPAALATRWIVTGKESYGKAAIRKMLKEPLQAQGGPHPSKLWSHSLAYDWLYNYPGFREDEKQKVVDTIKARLATELDRLDNTGMALWHGRNQAANGVMIAALGIAEHLDQKTLQRALAHYIDTIRALQYSEGWPEGASYWIYNRAGPYAMAADCVLSALGKETIDGVSIREIMKKIGYWSLYQYGPNGVFEPYGDSSGSLRLGQTGWWTVTVDYFARLSRDPGLMAGADYLRNRSLRPYGKRPYYWYIALTYDPSTRPLTGDYNPEQPELWMRNQLPQAKLFGRESMGVAYFRGKWGNPHETYASFKAGDFMAHHDHYDAGHFSIQCGGMLAPQTGIYSVGYWSDHRLGYAVQTVSANSLLVLAPGETSSYLNHKKLSGRNIRDKLAGGQRVIRPTSFWCASMKHYREIKDSGPHLERATITAWKSVPDEFDYVAADITAAYNSTVWAEPGAPEKVSLVTRQFVYLRPEKAFVVYDRVNTTDASYLPKFLLHHLSKPISSGETLLAGKGLNNGIIKSQGRMLLSKHKDGQLIHHALLPENMRILKIGGPDYQCYVETDGNQRNGFDGDNLTVTPKEKALKQRKTTHIGFWRTETEPASTSRHTRFLNILLPRHIEDKKPLPEVRLVKSGKNTHAAAIGRTIVVFARNNETLHTVKINHSEGMRCLITCATPNTAYQLPGHTLTSDKDGFLIIDSLPEEKEVTITRH